MTEEQALIATILAHPADDLPRLVYADWLDEQGFHERAEFIRVQCELAKHWQGVGDCTCRQLIDKYHCDNCLTWERTEELRDRERELFATLPHELPDDFFRCVSTVAYSYSRIKSDPLAVYDRGFVESVRLPLAAFLGGECENCGGEGTVETGIREGSLGPCPDCGGEFEPRDEPGDLGYSPGTGRTEGIAAALFRSQPVTRVEFADREPYPDLSLTLGTAETFDWLSGHDDDEFATAVVTQELFNLMQQERPGNVTPAGRGYRAIENRTRELAITALSDAAVAYGRSLADLPPLRATPPAEARHTLPQSSA